MKLISIFNREESEIIVTSNEAFAPVGYLKLKKLSLEKKENVLKGEQLVSFLNGLVKTYSDYSVNNEVNYFIETFQPFFFYLLLM